jgi:hypothetical protein
VTRRITDDELARRIVEVLHDRYNPGRRGVCLSAYDLAYDLEDYLGNLRESRILRRLRALRDEGRVVEVAGPRGSLWRLP